MSIKTARGPIEKLHGVPVTHDGATDRNSLFSLDLINGSDPPLYYVEKIRKAEKIFVDELDKRGLVPIEKYALSLGGHHIADGFWGARTKGPCGTKDSKDIFVPTIHDPDLFLELDDLLTKLWKTRILPFAKPRSETESGNYINSIKIFPN